MGFSRRFHIKLVHLSKYIYFSVFIKTHYPNLKLGFEIGYQPLWGTFPIPSKPEKNFLWSNTLAYFPRLSVTSKKFYDINDRKATRRVSFPAGSRRHRPVSGSFETFTTSSSLSQLSSVGFKSEQKFFLNVEISSAD